MLPLFPWKFLQQLSLAPPHPQEESQTNLFVQHLIGYLDRRKPSTAGSHKSCWMINYSVLFQNGNDKFAIADSLAHLAIRVKFRYHVLAQK